MPLNEQDREFILHAIRHNSAIKHKKGWHNFTRNVKLPHALVLDIDNVASLQKVMKIIYQLSNKKDINERIIVRAAAGGRGGKYSKSYSFTSGVEGDVIVRLTGDVFRRMQHAAGENVMLLGGSLQIGETNQILYDQYNLVMPTASLISYVTIAGLSANAGHGTGKDQPGFAGLIRAMTLCLPNGDIVRVDETHPDFATIRGSHLGLFGIVISVELQCMPAKKIQCVMEKRSLPEFLDEVKDGLFRLDYKVSAMYVPTGQPDELTTKQLKNVLILRYRPVDKEVENVNYEPLLSSLRQAIEIAVQDKFHMDDLLVAAPWLVPPYMQYLVSRTKIGCKDQIAVGPWSMVHYQLEFPDTMNDMSYLFPVKDSANCDEIVAAYTKLATVLAECAQRQEYPVAYATYGRYIAGTNGGLSISTHREGEHLFGFDIVSLPGIKGFDQFRHTMSTYFMEELHGKPHWGKFVPENINYADLYGDAHQQFIDTLQRWYASHDLSFVRSLFLNDFACQILNLSMVAPSVELVRTISNDELLTPVPVCELAQAAVLCVEGDDEQACQLRRCLNQLAVSHPLTKSTSSLFAEVNRLVQTVESAAAIEEVAVMKRSGSPPTRG